jgi:alpha-mannosidase
MTKLMKTAAGIVALLAVTAAAASPAAAPKDAAKPDLTKEKVLYTVGYAHLDTQWRWTYLTTVNQYIPKTMRLNFALFEKYPHYTFNFTGANRYRLMKEYYPADYLKVKEWVKAGRWFPAGSSWEEINANEPSSESIVRQVLYGNEYFRRELGKASDEFMLPDSFGFQASLPSILAHAGMKGFSTQKLVGWQPANPIPFNFGLWEGPDGKSVIVAINPGSYSARVTTDLSTDPQWVRRLEANGKSAGVFTDYHYYGTGDTGGSPTPDSVDLIEKALANNGPIKVLSATANQFFDDLTAAEIAKLPKYQGDFLLIGRSSGTLTSEAFHKRAMRKNELLADSAERASVVASAIGAAAYPMEKITDAWHLFLAEQFHDTMAGPAIPNAYDYAWNNDILGLNESAAVVENSVGAVARALDTKGSQHALVVYNPLSIEREDMVEASVAFAGAAPAAIRVIGPDGKDVPAQIASSQAGTVKVLFLAKVPAVGFAVYDVQPAATPAAGGELKVTANSLENARYRVTLDANGDASEVFDKAEIRQVLSAPARLAFLHEDHASAWNMDWRDRQLPPYAYVDGKPTIRIVESGPARVALEVTREAQGSKFIQRIRLAAGSDRVEFDTRFDWQTKVSSLKAVFPMSVSNPLATYNMEAGTIQRGNNVANKFEVPSHQWLDLTAADGSYGASILEDCKYGSDKPDDNTLRLTLVLTASGSNLGSQNSVPDQKTQDLGKHQVLYALAAHKRGWQAGQTPLQAARLNQPLIAFAAPAHDGALGKSFSLLKLNAQQVIVRAVKQAEDSDEIIVRLQELDGTAAAGVKLATAWPILSAREVDGQEQTIGAAKVENGQLVVDMGKYALRAFALKLQAAPVKLSPPQSQPVALPYDLNVVSADGQKSPGGFDADGRCIAAEMLPATITAQDVTFQIAPAGQNNAVACKGQMIDLPAGNFNRIYILAAANGGPVDGTFKVGDTQVKLAIQDWTKRIGQWDRRLWNMPLRPNGFPAQAQMTGLEPGYIHRDQVAWYSSHRHSADGTNDTFEYSYLFKYALDLPAGAKQITLPNDPRIRIMAITAASNANDDARPAQPLYDELPVVVE